MISKVLSSAILGIDAYLVEVEVDIALGFPQFLTVGLPEGAVGKGEQGEGKGGYKELWLRLPPEENHGKPCTRRH